MALHNCELGMVVGPHPFTADAGLKVLRDGGNAFDAVVAAAFTEAVVEPGHNGVAGYGGAMVGWDASAGQVVCVDFNTEAPGAARHDMFPTELSAETVYRVPGAEHRRGPRSIGVPGVVDGLDVIHRCWGKLSLRQVMGPAIRAARDGWPCNRLTHRHLTENAPEMRSSFPETAHLLMPHGRVPQPGEIMTNRELGDTLEMLSVVGLRDFYEGELAVRIVTGLRRGGGLLELEDLAGYQAQHVQPTAMDYRGHRLVTPPVGCGGVTSFQILRVLDALGTVSYPLDGADFYHAFSEVLKACWRRRVTTLGDPRSTKMPEEAQLEEAVIGALAAEASRGIAAPRPGQPLAPDAFGCTSHVCAADAQGNVASLTQTHGGQYGSFVSLPGTGLIFGHGMARFDPRPGWPNSIAPGKRPLHNMAPMLALREGRPVAAYGTPGGRTIVNNQAYFSLALFARGLALHETLALPRLHVEEAEPVKLEARAGEAVIAELRSLGHAVEIVEQSGGPAHGVLIGSSPSLLAGATDPRNEGKVAWA